VLPIAHKSTIVLIKALGHCRLSINDLSTAGSQPLHSPSNTVHAVVNGEIYDHERIRGTLSYTFTGHSDSELVLALYEAHGLDFLSHLRGEFALALYDSQRDIFIAARDRYGIKPLFWRRESGSIWLGAEIKAFLGAGWTPEWDVQAIMDGGWGQDTRTVFKGVQKVSGPPDCRTPRRLCPAATGTLYDMSRRRRAGDQAVLGYLLPRQGEPYRYGQASVAITQ